MVYYNEIDPKAAAWLRELIKQGHIAPGDVDERSIADVEPADLMGYDQCHFFAGIGVWSYALRQAGWPDDREVWTGSCPCQPFSTAGKGKGKEDKRHLWPEMFRLIRERKPHAVFGEQVGGKAGLAWLDDVQTDLEGIDYACGAITFPACSVGAPHQRQREYWVTTRNVDDSSGLRGSDIGGKLLQTQKGQEQTPRTDRTSETALRLGNSNSDRFDQTGKCITEAAGDGSVGNSAAGRMADADEDRLQGQQSSGDPQGRQGSDIRSIGLCDGAGNCDGLADATGNRQQGQGQGTEIEKRWAPESSLAGELPDGPERRSVIDGPLSTNGRWKDVDWLYCRDGKWRPVEPGTIPLANGATERVGLLRGYGNAIVAEQAKIFIEAFME